MQILSLAIVLAAAAGASTPPPMSGHVAVTHAWFRALPANLPAGGYFDLKNTDSLRAAVLTGAELPACGMLMLHRSSDKNGVGSMEDVESVEAPPSGTIKFAPGGYHLMCMDPTPAMKIGASVPVTLKFRDTSIKTVTFAVKNAKGQ